MIEKVIPPAGVEVRPWPRHPRYLVGDDGSVWGPRGKRLKPFPNKYGYMRINVYTKGSWSQHSVHTLVCEAFIGEMPADKDLVAHADGDPANNSLSNLRWTTFKENEQDKRGHGRNLQGERHHQACLTTADVLDIRARRSAGEAGKDLAVEYGVSTTTIAEIHLRQSWSHVP